MLQTSLQNKKPNVYNVLTNYLTFFIFVNLNQSVNIKKELNNIFDKNCLVKINNESIDFDLFIKIISNQFT